MLHQLKNIDQPLRRRLSSTISTSIAEQLILTGLLAYLLRLPVLEFTKGAVHSCFHLQSSGDSDTLANISSFYKTGALLVGTLLASLKANVLQRLPSFSHAVVVFDAKIGEP